MLKNELLLRFREFFIENFGIKLLEEGNILLAVSGGVDSTVMMDLFAKSDIPFSIAHLNFQLRGQDADQDEAFVKAQASAYSVPCYAKKVDTKSIAKQEKSSIQLTARRIRYAWFEELATAHGCQAIATAHHADDQVETIIHRIIRGSGLKGLSGIPTRNKNIIRPLLFAKKQEIFTYAEENNISWREDYTNSKIDYTRNKIRKKIIPLFTEINPNIHETLSRNINRWKSAHQFLENYLEQIRLVIIEKNSDTWILNTEKISRFQINSFHNLWLILDHFDINEAEAEMIYHLIYSQAGKKIITSKYEWIKNQNHITIYPIEKKIYQSPILVSKDQKTIQISHKTWKISTFSRDEWSLKRTAEIAQLDAQKLQFPLAVRSWQPGDKIQPIGMSGKKLVSDLLTDLKLDLHQKAQVRVWLTDGQIVWIEGIRIAEPFRITDQTHTIMVIAPSDSAE